MSILDRIMDEAMPRPPGKEDWAYRDLPQIREDFWQTFLDMVGEDNLHFITFAEYRHDDGLYKRGQVFISPAGMARLASHANASPSTARPLSAPDAGAGDETNT